MPNSQSGLQKSFQESLKRRSESVARNSDFADGSMVYRAILAYISIPVVLQGENIMDRRKELKLAYKQNCPWRGISD